MNNTDKYDVTAAPLDTQELLQRCMKSVAIAGSLLEKFETQLRADLVTIGRQLAAGDTGEIARTAHGLKGAAGALAAAGVRECAARIELLAREPNLAPLAEEFDRLRAETERCLAYIPKARAVLAADTGVAPFGKGPGQ